MQNFLDLLGFEHNIVDIVRDDDKGFGSDSGENAVAR